MTLHTDLRSIRALDHAVQSGAILTPPARHRHLCNARTVIRQEHVDPATLRAACDVLMAWGDWSDMKLAEGILARLPRAEASAETRAAGVIVWLLIALIFGAIAGLWITDAIAGAAFDAARPAQEAGW